MAAAVSAAPPPPPVTTPAGIVRLRGDLGLTQTHLGALLNAHTVTVARWEGATLSPDPWQTDMLSALRRATDSGEAPEKDALRAAIDKGAAYGLQAILAALPAPRRSTPPAPAAAPQANQPAARPLRPQPAHGRA